MQLDMEVDDIDYKFIIQETVNENNQILMPIQHLYNNTQTLDILLFPLESIETPPPFFHQTLKQCYHHTQLY